MSRPWTFAVARDDLKQTILAGTDVPDLRDGEALLRVDRVGLTANNVTYAVLGDAMRYWEFFPPEPRGLTTRWGLPPLWGFAEVTASTCPGVTVGTRVYGYLPPASHLVVKPDRIDDTGFRDAGEHRADLPSPYNAYRTTTGDPVYRPDDEDLLILYRPLFFTSFMLADQVIDNDFYGAGQILVSSASSKTAYAAARRLHGAGPRLVALTSRDNVAFTRTPTAYLDLSGAPATRAALRERLGDLLVRDIAVGLTNQVPNAAAAGEVFFAPVQMRKRRQDWGRDGLEQRFTAAWQQFAGAAADSVDIQVGKGPDDLRSTWLTVLGGQAAPRTGHVIQL
jgi:hypothetical protein